MRTSLRKIAVATTAALVMVIASTAAPTSAEARWAHHGGWGWAPGFAGGVIVGSALAAPYYYGGPYAYDYGPDCYIRRQVHVNRFGEEVIRRVRVCY
jgi:hypothetical protein